MSQYRINIGTTSLVLPNVTTTSATLNCPLTISAGSSTLAGINLNAVTQNRRIALSIGSDQFQYTGFGLAGDALKYSVASSSANHDFYTGNATPGETLLFRVKGGGGFSSLGDSTVTGSLTATTLNATGLTTNTVIRTDGSKNLTSIASGSDGQVLTLSGGLPTWSAVSAPSTIGATIGYFASAVQAITTSEAVFTINTPLALSQNTSASTGITHSAGVFTNGVSEATKMVLVVANISTGLLVAGFTLIRIYVNSTINNQVIYTTNSSSTTLGTISAVVKMAASDTVSVRVISSANTDIVGGAVQGAASKVCLTILGVTS